MIEINVVNSGRGAAWLVEGFEYFRRSAGAWIGTSIILIIINIVSGVIPFAGIIIMQLLTPVFIGGLLLGCRDIANNGKLEINHLFSGFNKDFGNLVVLGLIYTLGSIFIIMSMLLVAFVTVGLDFFINFVNGGSNFIIEDFYNSEYVTSILMIVLIGLIFYVPLLMSFWFAPALIVLDGQKPLESIKNSFVGCLKNTIPFLVYGMVGLILSILATIPLLLGWFILMPIIIASIYISYLEIYNSNLSITQSQV
ncbi:MAG: hypothetical protein ACI9XC_000250 [Gammaproteobacteria bacterium]|jgi:hypothetical protein